jgi:hypothetical protein
LLSSWPDHPPCKREVGIKASVAPQENPGLEGSVMMAQPPKVLLTTLTERTSAKGNVYLTGWLAKARVVGFRGEDDEHGNPTWNLYLSEPGERPQERQERPARASPPSTDQLREQRTQRNAAAAQARNEHAMQTLNDPIPE